MKTQEAIDLIHYEWARPGGFLGNLREGCFVEEDAKRFSNLLVGIGDYVRDQATLDKRLVSLLWYIPLFMEWQEERVCEAGAERQEYLNYISEITNILEEILGIP